MDISSSSRTRDSQSDSSIIDNTTNVNTVTTASTPITPLPQNNSSLVLILDEAPPPPYPTDSKLQIPTPSHSRDHTTITLTSPPEYTSSASIITTQPQPQIMSLSPNNNRFSDISTTNTTNEDMSTRALLNAAQQLKFCKICQESEESSSSNVLDFETYKKGKLISPCKCKGSLQYVHIGCLNQWRHSNVRAEASYRCEVCKYEYRFYRPRIAKIFSSILLVSCFGLIFFLIMICFSGFSHTRHSYCYIGGCDNSFCLSYGGCSGSDCSGSGCAGATIAAYLLIQKIISICLGKVHDRILELFGLVLHGKGLKSILKPKGGASILAWITLKWSKWSNLLTKSPL
ncbi:5442_t:CDS:2 [Rhizophagus irregularis]|nr:5442_t:CDS:2 [Rhizophagus irregularis]